MRNCDILNCPDIISLIDAVLGTWHFIGRGGRTGQNIEKEIQKKSKGYCQEGIFLKKYNRDGGIDLNLMRMGWFGLNVDRNERM